MKIISFAWTTPALLAGRKTVTRRDWSPEYARRFSAGELVQAYDRSPRLKGKCVATIRIVSVTWEPDSDAPDSDYEAEGFGWMVEQQEATLDDLYAQALNDGMNPEEDPRVWSYENKLRDRGALSFEDFDVWRQQGGWSWVCRFEVVS